MNKSLLSLRDVRYRWPDTEADCIDIAQLELAAAEAVFLRGPSGCGKSTLLSIVAGVLAVNHGAVTLLGLEWSGLSAARRDRLRADHVGYIFQQFNLLPYLSVLDNVLLPCRFSGRRATRATETHGSARAAAEYLLQRMGLGAAYWPRASARLSVGQQQRVAAARALIGRPELVIADEPTSALDESLRDDFMRLLLESCAQAGSGLLFVSHDARLADHFGRQIDLPVLNRAAQELNA
ncbi:MAG: ABC transporter ATP-binding protein [Leptothrix sp. (in: b-proteobacteria)]